MASSEELRKILLELQADTNEIKDRLILSIEKIADAIGEQTKAVSTQSSAIQILCAHLEVLKNSVPVKVMFLIFALVFALVFGVSILKHFGLLAL